MLQQLLIFSAGLFLPLHIKTNLPIRLCFKIAVRYGKTVKRREKAANQSAADSPNSSSRAKLNSVSDVGSKQQNQTRDTKNIHGDAGGNFTNFELIPFKNDNNQQTPSASTIKAHFNGDNNTAYRDTNSPNDDLREAGCINNTNTNGNNNNNRNHWFHSQTNQTSAPQAANNLVKQYDVVSAHPDTNNCISAEQSELLRVGDNQAKQAAAFSLAPYSESTSAGFEVNSRSQDATASPSRLTGARLVESGEVSQGRQQDFVVGSEFTSSASIVQQQQQQLPTQQNVPDNVPIDEILCEPFAVDPLKSETSATLFNSTGTTTLTTTTIAIVAPTSTTSQNRITDTTACFSLKSDQNDPKLSISASEITERKPISQLEELYQFEQDYFYGVGFAETEALQSGIVSSSPSASDAGSLQPFSSRSDPLNKTSDGAQENGTRLERSKLVGERLNDRKSVLVLKQPPTSASANNNFAAGSLLKSAPNESKRQPAGGEKKEESCQGYNNQNETDDRLKQLSLRFSADANNKKLGSHLSLNGDDTRAVERHNESNIICRASEVDMKKKDSEKMRLGDDAVNINESRDALIDTDEKFDIYSFEFDSVMKEGDGCSNEQDFQSSMKIKNEIGDKESGSHQALNQHMSKNAPTESYDDQSMESDNKSTSTESELEDLIDRISTAHHDTCSFLKTKTSEIEKKQSISSLPNIAGSQYCRYRNNGQHSGDSPNSSLINGSAGSSASSVSSGSSINGGSPMNNIQYITSSPSLSPSANSAAIVPVSASHSSHITSYLDSASSSQSSTNHQHNISGASMKTVDSIKQSKPAHDLASRAEVLEEYKITLWQEYALLINPSIQQVVEFAKQVPGFLALNQLDQLLLIKSGFFEIWLVTIAGMFNFADNTLTFADGTFIEREQLDLMFDKTFSSFAFNFSISFNQLCLDDTEIGLVSAIILLQPSK